MKKQWFITLALAGLFAVSPASAISLSDIPLWTGSGTNSAALVIEWSVPQSLTYSTVPVPVADKTLVWGYRFNGAATGTQMLRAVLATDPRLYVVADVTFGTFVEGIGYNLSGNGILGITDGSGTNLIADGFLTNATVDIDSAQPISSGDLYWGGLYGPNWEVWNETNDAGGFLSSPNRGTNAYWTPTDTVYYSAGYQGQWEIAQGGLDDLALTNGSWIGFSVAAGEYEAAATAPYNSHKHAPVSPDGIYAAYICNSNDFAVQVVSSSNVFFSAAASERWYTNALAVLGRPTLKFIDGYGFFGDGTVHRVKADEPAYWCDPGSNNVLTEINAGGQITVSLGRRIYHSHKNPYGIDFNVFGNSFYVASGYGGSEMNDLTDQGAASFGGTAGTYGHPTTVSVSQDGTNWFTYPYLPVLVPDNAYRWDDPNHAWTDEQMNETKPLNPSLDFPSGLTVASALDQYVGAYGGSGYSLQASGLPWIQYVRINAGTSLTDTTSSDYTVIDAIGAVDPITVGDALSITPANLAAGITNLVFQNPADLNETLISLNFESASASARISTVSLHEFSAFAPVVGSVCSAYQIQARPLPGTSSVALQADLGLAVGRNYSGNGGDLRVYQWHGTNWAAQPFTFNPANAEVLVPGVTNFTAMVISQIVPPSLSARNSTNGFALQFTPVANCSHVLERSADLVNWSPLYTNTLTSAQPVTWYDPNPPATRAFYRVQLYVP